MVNPIALVILTVVVITAILIMTRRKSDKEFDKWFQDCLRQAWFQKLSEEQIDLMEEVDFYSQYYSKNMTAEDAVTTFKNNYYGN